MLGTWERRGNVEKYFKHRYRDFNYPIDTLTEYFNFDNPEDAKVVLRDLRRMKPKVLTQSEIEVLEGKPSKTEGEIQAQGKASQRSSAS